ncbi:type IV secretion system protein VirB6 [Anaplasma centrale str. Israel]|uniref:Type IV secretion system protein VirB6 n=1 Tax=Anaplasma centrale (strain Israel) TaxID=574556 RepID=D1AUB0_ANACI|nr:type IV secretion system protein [Anaplasma centrale]ACZ49138.1 type IV secretion system protein VirB6 [Anaplasma centrale str. Israel]
MRRAVKAIALIVLFTGLPFLPHYAAYSDEPKGEESDRLVSYRYAEATNPRCGAAATVAEVGAKVIGPSLGFMITGAILIKIPLGWTTKAGIALISTNVPILAAAVGASSAYFVCNWSFVRHPVLRFEEGDIVRGTSGVNTVLTGETSGTGDTSGFHIGKYKECSEPYAPDDAVKGRWENIGAQSGTTSQQKEKCSREFADLNSYFACIAPNESLEKARLLEPICKSRKFKQVEHYAWPKNRVSSSRYIEVCYRKPLATLFAGAYRALRNQVSTESYTEQIKKGAYPREGTYGDAEMHKTKLAISGAGQGETPNTHVKCEVLKAGEKKTIHDAEFRAVERGDKLCVDAVSVSSLPLIPRPEIGCQMRPNSPPVPMCKESEPKMGTGDMKDKVVGYDNSKCYSCYVDQACQGVASKETKSPFPVTSVLINCIYGSLKNILDPTRGGVKDKCAGKVTSASGPNPGFLSVAQNKLKNAVMAALILALILFSIKAMLGGVQNASELYMTAIKFALVIYFTQGGAMYKAYEHLTNLSIGLSDIVLSAANGGQNICDYKAGDYDKDFRYLMPWDRLDCRMMFYLGSQLNGGTGTGVLLTVFLCAGLLIPAILINAKVIICVVAFFAVMMLIFTVIWCVYVFLLSLIALTVLTIISPIMIPMCLFQVTKGFFDGWTRQLMIYSLYPVILFSFLSLMFTVFDNIYFDDLKFTREDITVGDLKRINFKLENEKACDGKEDNLACMFSTVNFHTKPLVLGLSVTSPEFKNTTAAIWTKLGVFVLVGFLFYHFLSSISYIAGELAGDPRAGVIGSGSLNPRALAGGAMGAASKVSSYASGKMSDVGSKALDRMRGGGGQGGAGSDKVSGGSTPRSGGAGTGTDAVSGGSSGG